MTNLRMIRVQLLLGNYEKVEELAIKWWLNKGE